jgi:alpha-D-xyloside xylohydrolase
MCRRLVVLLLLVCSITTQAASDCVIVSTADQDVKIEAFTANALRVRAVPTGGKFRDDLISALLPTPSDGVASQYCTFLNLATGPTDVTNGNIKATMGADGKLTFTRVSDSKVLLVEKSARKLVPTTTTPPLPGFFSLDLSFEAVDGEQIYGLGQHKTGKLDNKGVKGLQLNPRNTELLIPIAHSSEGYAFLFNLPSFGRVEYNETDSYWHADAVVQADFWVATTADGPTYAQSPWAQLQRSYADATGHAPVYPDWTSGFWQCRNRYHNQSQIMDVAQGYIDRQYPISLIIIDYFSWNDPAGGSTPLGDETLPASCWPDPKMMVDLLKEKGVELMISPYFHSVTDASKNYQAARDNGYLVQSPDGTPAKVAYADAYLYDLFNPEARAYAFDAVNEGYIKPYGLHHWWLDCDEPCGGNMDDLVYNNGTWPAAFVGSAYAHMLDMMVWEGMGAPGKQYEHDNVMLGRSAWAGSQRYGGAVWSGDTSSTFRDLNQQFRAGLNLVMSGIPYWTTDIGGYNGGNIDSANFRQLIVRWFQWGAFCPLFRLHGKRHGGPPSPPGDAGVCGTDSSNEIWNFGNESEIAIARVMRMREQMRPYVMGLYRQVHSWPVLLALLACTLLASCMPAYFLRSLC